MIDGSCVFVQSRSSRRWLRVDLVLELCLRAADSEIGRVPKNGAAKISLAPHANGRVGLTQSLTDPGGICLGSMGRAPAAVAVRDAAVRMLACVEELRRE